jgi:glycosyltransferase involved in cell wall biosynthesis
MSAIILDCGLMKHPNSGLYYYCLQLGLHVNKIFGNLGVEKMKFYVPPREKNAFGDKKNTIVEERLHLFTKPFLRECRVWHAPFQSGRIIPKNKSVKVVLTIHDLNSLHEGMPLKDQQKSIAHTQKLIDASNAIVCISEFVKQDVLQNCSLGDKPLYVIHNGFHVVSEGKLNASSYQPNYPFLFALGYVNTKKNYHVLLPLLQNNDNLELIIAGKLADHNYIETINKQADSLGVAHRLHITGPVTDNEKSWYLRNCEAFMHPSLAEGFGATVVEAMSFGKPVFISALTALPEIAGDAAFYFKNFDSDHMQEVFINGMQDYDPESFKQKILKRAEDFRWENKAAEYIKVYQSLM